MIHLCEHWSDPTTLG